MPSASFRCTFRRWWSACRSAISHHVPEQGGIRTYASIEHPETFGLGRFHKAAEHVGLCRFIERQLHRHPQVFARSREQFLDLSFRRRPGMLHQANGLGVCTRIFFSQLYQTVKSYLKLFVPRVLVLSDWLPARISSNNNSCQLAGSFSRDF